MGLKTSGGISVKENKLKIGENVRFIIMLEKCRQANGSPCVIVEIDILT